MVRLVFNEVDVNIEDSEELIVRCPDYVQQLGHLIHNTPPRSVVSVNIGVCELNIYQSVGKFVDWPKWHSHCKDH